MLHRPICPEGSIRNAFELFKHSCGFVTTQRVLIERHALLSSIGLQILVPHFYCVLAIHFLVGGLMPLTPNGIYGKIDTSIVALRQIMALVLQHVLFIIPGATDACWGNRHLSDSHELRKVDRFSGQIRDVVVKPLAKENVHKTSCGHGTLVFDHIAVSPNRHNPSPSRTHQYSRLRICGYCDLKRNAT